MHPTRKHNQYNKQAEDMKNTTKPFCCLHPKCMWGTIFRFIHENICIKNMTFLPNIDGIITQKVFLDFIQ